MENEQEQPAAAGPVDCRVRAGPIMLAHDDVSQRLDEMAELCERWKHWREVRGHTPNAIRGALVMLSREVAMLADMEQKHRPRTEPL